jgi:hypothetical protein
LKLNWTSSGHGIKQVDKEFLILGSTLVQGSTFNVAEWGRIFGLELRTQNER